MSGWLLAHRHSSPCSWFAWRGRMHVADLREPVVVRLAVDSKYWLYVNGHVVIREGGLKRGPAPGETYADILDLTPWLVEGENVIALHHWYFGRDGFSHASSGAAGFFWKIGRGVARMVRPWVVREDTAFFDAGTVRPGSALGYRLAENSIGYDARASLGAWTERDFDDSTWAAALASPTDHWGALTDRPIPQFSWGDLRTVETPVGEKDHLGYSIYRIKLPYNAQFVPFFSIKARPGLKIQILSDSPEHCLIAEYVTADGELSWESPGWLNGHEIVFRIPDSIRVLQLGYRETAFSTTVTGQFNSADTICHELWQRSLRTLLVTMRDSFMDCPDRERAQWWGDEVIQLGQVFYCLDANAISLIRKGILEFAAWQRADDVLYSPIPSGNCFRELPLQSLASMGRYGIGEYLWHTGDVAAIRTIFPALVRYLNIWEFGATGLPLVREGGWKWSDWGGNCDHEALTSCWFWLALDGVACMADRLGETNLAMRFRQQAAALAAAFRQSCWTSHGVRGPGHDGPPDERANALAVLCGFHQESERPILEEILFGRREASPYMEKYVLEALFVLNRADLALQRMRERYRGMLDFPITTLFERFTETGLANNTYNHSWSGAPLIVLSRWVAGVEPLAEGWQAIRFCPQPGDLRDFSVSLSPPCGPVSVDYVRAENGYVLKVEFPAHVEVEWDLSHLAASGENTEESQEWINPPLQRRGPGGCWTLRGLSLVQ